MRWLVEEGLVGVVVWLVNVQCKWINQADPLNSSEDRVYAMGCSVVGGVPVDEVVSFGLGGWLDCPYPLKIVHVTHARFLEGYGNAYLSSLGMRRSGVEGSVEGVGGGFSSVWLYKPHVDPWDQKIPRDPMLVLRTSMMTVFDVRRKLVFWTLPGQTRLTEHGDLTVNMLDQFPSEGNLILTPY